MSSPLALRCARAPEAGPDRKRRWCQAVRREETLGWLSSLGKVVCLGLLEIKQTRSKISVFSFPHPSREPSTQSFRWQGDSCINLRMRGVVPPRDPYAPTLPTILKVLLVSTQHLLLGQVQRQFQEWESSHSCVQCVFSTFSVFAGPGWGCTKWFWAGLVLLESRVLQLPCHKWNWTKLKQRFPLAGFQSRVWSENSRVISEMWVGTGTGYVENWEPHLVSQSAFKVLI